MEKFYVFIEKAFAKKLKEGQCFSYDKFSNYCKKDRDELFYICKDMNSLLFSSCGIDDFALVQVGNLGEVYDNSDILDDVARAYIGATCYKFNKLQILKIYNDEEFFNYIDTGLSNETISLRVVVNSIDCPDFIKNKYPQSFIIHEGAAIQTLSLDFLEKNQNILDWNLVSENYNLSKEVIEHFESKLSIDRMPNLPENISFDFVKKYEESLYNNWENLLYCDIPTDFILKHLNQQMVKKIFRYGNLSKVNKYHHSIFLNRSFLQLVDESDLINILFYNIYTLEELKSVADFFPAKQIVRPIYFAKKDYFNLESFTELYNYICNTKFSSEYMNKLFSHSIFAINNLTADIDFEEDTDDSIESTVTSNSLEINHPNNSIIVFEDSIEPYDEGDIPF